jgi:transcriptional regulator with XRE-family HTH domain
MKPPEDIGARIRAARKAKGLTLAALGKAVGVNKVSAWAWEAGKAKPRLDKVQLIATALGVTPEALLRNPVQGSADLADLIADCRTKIAEAAGLDVARVQVVLVYGDVVAGGGLQAEER